MRLTIAFFAAILATYARAEVAIVNEPNAVFFSVEGDHVYRHDCTPGTRDYTRATCNTGQRTAAATDFFPRLAASFGVHLEQSERNLRDAWTVIARIDQKLFELATLPNDPGPAPVTLEQVDAARRQLAALEKKAADLTDQVNRILALLREDGADADLLRQYDLDRAARNDAVRAAETQRDAFSALRDRYLASRHAQDDGAYQNLVDMRDARTREAARAQKSIADALHDIEGGMKLADQIRETNFTYDYSSAWYPYDMAPPAFAASEEEFRTARGHVDAVVNALSLDYPADGKLETVVCDFGVRGNVGRCDYAVEAPNGAKVAFYSWFSTDADMHIDLLYLKNGGPGAREALDQSHIYEAPMRGKWTVTWSCDGTPQALPGHASDCLVRRAPEAR